MPQTLVLDSISKERAIYDLEPINFKKLEDALCEAVAQALTAPNTEHGQLTPDNVEVDIITSTSYKTGNNKLRIIVFANDFDERRADLQKTRVHKITEAVRAIVPDDVKGFVYVRLAPAGFAEF